MSELLVYIGKSSLCLSLLLLFFVFLLQKETFLKLNRWILLGNILLAFTLPILETPAWFSDFDLVKIESPQKNMTDLASTSPVEIEIATPVTEEKSRINLNWKAIFLVVYLVGFLIFMLRFLAQFFSIFLLILTSERERIENILFVYPGKILAPFSFFSLLFIDKNAYDSPTLEQIIAHEKVHIQQRHSWDILLSELLIIIQWFNPFAWWHRKSVETNLEFLVDHQLLKEGTDQKTYQYNLLKIAVPNFPYSLATNYNSSLLKKRIMMMQQKRSSASHSWKYFLLLPIVLMIWTAFGIPNLEEPSTPFISIITADATETDIAKAQDIYRSMDATLIINELKFDEKDRLSELNVTSLSGKDGECTTSIEGYTPYFYSYYQRSTKNTFRCGSLFSNLDLEKLNKSENWDFIFIDGQRPNQDKVNQLIINTEKWRAATKEKIKNTSPKSMGTTSYINLTAEKKAIIKEKITAAKTTTIYYLDGLKTDKTIDDFDYKDIRSIKLNEKQINYYDAHGDLLETLTDTIEVKIISQ